MSPASACCFAQLQAQPHALDLAGDLAAFQRVPGPPPAEVFFRNALDSCDRLMLDALARLDLGASGAGSSSCAGRPRVLPAEGVTTRSAASVFTGGRAGRDGRLQRLDAAAGEVAAPQANRVLAHAERFRDARAGPARQRQQHRPRPVRLAAIARTGQRPQRHALLLTAVTGDLPAMLPPANHGEHGITRCCSLVKLTESA